MTIFYYICKKIKRNMQNVFLVCEKQNFWEEFCITSTLLTKFEIILWVKVLNDKVRTEN